MARERVNEVKVTGPVTLDDLRWLVDECAGLDGTSKVSVQGRKEHGQLDFDPELIVVHGKDAGRGRG